MQKQFYKDTHILLVPNSAKNNELNKMYSFDPK